MTPTLTLRLTAPNEPLRAQDWCIYENGNRIGRIRYASEVTNPVRWFWYTNLPYKTVPANQLGWAATLDEAKPKFRASWEAYKRVVPAASWRGVF